MFALEDEAYRYDVVTVVLSEREEDNSTPQIELLRNFWKEEQLRKRRWHERYYD